MRAFLFVLLGFSACSSGARSAGGEPDAMIDQGDAARFDGGPVARPDAGGLDAGPADSGGPALVDSGCPAPPPLGPTDLPPGYMPSVVVRYDHNPDGDTADFGFATAGQQTIRFLYVNTEEAHGAETTEFGIFTGTVVRAWFENASEVQVAVRESSPGSGLPDLDPYDRWLGLVYIDGELVEERLLREGFSAYYTLFGCAPEPLHSAFIDAEAEARANQRGIWAPGHPTDYRTVLTDWIGRNHCRPEYDEPYCR